MAGGVALSAVAQAYQVAEALTASPGGVA